MCWKSYTIFDSSDCNHKLGINIVTCNWGVGVYMCIFSKTVETTGLFILTLFVLIPHFLFLVQQASFKMGNILLWKEFLLAIFALSQKNIKILESWFDNQTKLENEWNQTLKLWQLNLIFFFSQRTCKEEQFSFYSNISLVCGRMLELDLMLELEMKKGQKKDLKSYRLISFNWVTGKQF